MLMVKYADRLGREGFKVLGAGPGFCAMGMIGDLEPLKKMVATEPEAGAGLLPLLLRVRGILIWGRFAQLMVLRRGKFCAALIIILFVAW
jgi:hypothetical protein